MLLWWLDEELGSDPIPEEIAGVCEWPKSGIERPPARGVQAASQTATPPRNMITGEPGQVRKCPPSFSVRPCQWSRGG